MLSPQETVRMNAERTNGASILNIFVSFSDFSIHILQEEYSLSGIGHERYLFTASVLQRVLTHRELVDKQAAVQ